MKNTDIEKLLTEAKSSFVPDISDKIKEIKNIPTEYNEPKKQPLHFSRRLKIAFAFCMSLILIISASIFYGGFKHESYEVYLELNPVVELSVNRYDKVINVSYLNEDAKNLLKDEDLNNKSIEYVFDVFVEKSEEYGYFDDNSEISLSVYSDRDLQEKTQKAERKLQNSMDKKQVQCELKSQSINKQQKQEMEDKNITPNTYNIINQILALDNSYTFEELEKLSVSELKEILKELKGSNSNGGGSQGNGKESGNSDKENTGDTSGNNQSGKDQKTNENQNGKSSGNR